MVDTCLEEAVEGCEHDGHGQVLGVDEGQRLCHGDEHLLVHAVRDALLLHPLGHGDVVLLLDVLLATQDGWDESDGKLDLLGPREHLGAQMGTQSREGQGKRRK